MVVWEDRVMNALIQATIFQNQNNLRLNPTTQNLILNQLRLQHDQRVLLELMNLSTLWQQAANLNLNLIEFSKPTLALPGLQIFTENPTLPNDKSPSSSNATSPSTASSSENFTGTATSPTSSAASDFEDIITVKKNELPFWLEERMEELSKPFADFCTPAEIPAWSVENHFLYRSLYTPRAEMDFEICTNCDFQQPIPPNHDH